MDYKKDSVVILIPASGDVDPDVLVSIVSMATNAERSGLRLERTVIAKRMLIHESRNNLAEFFLKQTDAEWAFWVDTDMVLESHTITHMIKMAKAVGGKFMSGVYYQRGGNHNPVMTMRLADAVYKDEYTASFICPTKGSTRPYKVDGAGFGCMLTHRDVFENMKQPYFKFMIMDNGVEFSEDFYFCKKAKENNVQLWAVPDLKTVHLGSKEYITEDSFVPGKMMEIDLKTKKLKK